MFAGRRSCSVLLPLGFLFIAASALADDPKPTNPPLPSDPVFKAVKLDGTTISGRIRQLGPDSQVVLVDGLKESIIPFNQLFKLTREGDPPAFPPEGSVVLFPEGDRLLALINTSNEKTIELAPKILGDSPIRVPIDAPLALLLAPTSDLEAQEAQIHRFRDEKRTSAVLWLANGDRQEGDFLGLSQQKATFQRDAQAVEYDRSGIVAIGFDPTQTVYPAPKGTFLELTFLDGSRLGVTDCRLEGGQILATTRFGAVIKPFLTDLARIHVRSDSILYLSEKKEALADFVGYVGPHRGKYARDRTVDDRTLRLRGQPYDRGIGTYSRTLLAYKVQDPKNCRFQATVGLDDRAGPFGSVVFRVLVNGKEEKFASPPMTIRDAPVAVDIDLSGVRILILTVEFGERGDVQDFADWVEARIVRLKP